MKLLELRHARDARWAVDPPKLEEHNPPLGHVVRQSRPGDMAAKVNAAGGDVHTESRIGPRHTERYRQKKDEDRYQTV
jgi:hypothetical protein